MTKVLRRITNVLGAAELLAALGTAALCYGAWLIYQPAGYLVGGGLLLTAGVLIGRAKAKAMAQAGRR